MYSGPNDKMRLHREDNDKDAVDNVLSALFINPAVPAMEELPISLRPLHQYNMTERLAVLEGVPPYTPAGPARKVVPVPVVHDAEEAETPSASGAGQGEEEAAAGGEEDAAGEKEDAGGEEASSRARPHAGEICDISSGDDEGAFAGAPTRRAEEEESAGEASDEESLLGRREPRSKAACDRPGARPSDVPSKRKAEAPLERPDARPKPSWRSPGLAWVDTGAKRSR